MFMLLGLTDARARISHAVAGLVSPCTQKWTGYSFHFWEQAHRFDGKEEVSMAALLREMLERS